MINCAGINLNPQNFSEGISSAPLQIVVDAGQRILNGDDGFGIIKRRALNAIADDEFPSFIRDRFKDILGHSIPDNSKENLSSKDKIELSNLKEAMRVILDSDEGKKVLFFQDDRAKKALWQVLTVEDSQNENIEQKNTDNIIQEDTDVEQADELDEAAKLVLNQLGMSSSEFKKIIYTGATEEDSFRKTKLNQQIASTVVRDGIYINNNPWKLNENIVNLKNEWFKQLCKYLGESEEEKLFIRDQYYNKYTYNKFATGILNRFKIKALNSKLSIKADDEFKKAVNAFINLINFDEDIKEYMGKDISINRNTSTSFSEYNLPYGISSHNSLRSGWSTEELTDGMKNIPNMTKLLFDSIPEYRDGKETDLHLDAKNTIWIVKTFLNNCLQSSNTSQYLKNSIRVLRVSGNAKELFNEMFKVGSEYNEDISTIIRKMNPKDQVVINSFFRELNK